jgi:glutaredoxin
MMKLYFVLFGIMMIGGAQAEGLYRWVDSGGKVHYGDLPPAEGVQVEKKKFDYPADTAEDENMPYDTLRARQNFPVTLYVSANCGDTCQQARDFLNKRGIPFAEKKLTTQQEIDNFKKESGSDQAPTLSVGKTWLKGFLAGSWNNELDAAGYPKTSSYHPSVRPAAAKPETPPTESETPAAEPEVPETESGAPETEQ